MLILATTTQPSSILDPTTIAIIGIVALIIAAVTSTVGMICQIIGVFQTGKQTRVFVQGNDIAAGGTMLAPPRVSRKLPLLILFSSLVSAVTAVVLWAAILYNNSDRDDRKVIIVLLSLLAILILLVAVLLPMTKRRRQFDPDKIVFAEYGSNERGFHYWPDTGRSGEMLADWLRELLARPIPARLTNEFLGIHDPATSGPHKILRFRLSTGKYFFLHEYGMITIDSAVPMPPFEPFDPSAKHLTPPETQESVDRRGNYSADLLSATYGKGTKRRDVLARILEWRKQGKVIGVNHHDLLDGDDPASGEYKELILRYANGRKFRLYEGRITLSLFLELLESGYATDDWLKEYLI
jgi:hypothetical protein